MKSKTAQIVSCLSFLGLAACGTFKTPDAGSSVNIFGGEDDNGRFPATISLQRLREDGKWRNTCTATKIAKNMALTAAHCVMLDNGPENGTNFKAFFEPGTSQHIVTGPDSATGPSQEIKIKSVDLFPGFVDRFEKCTRVCVTLFVAGNILEPDQELRLPDMAIITYEDEIKDAAIAPIGVYSPFDTLTASGYGINSSKIEYDESTDTLSMGRKKKTLTFQSADIDTLISDLEASIAPHSTTILVYKDNLINVDKPLTIFIKEREPITKETFEKFELSKNPHDVENEMPPPLLGGYIMPGDSGGGIFRDSKCGNEIVGVASGKPEELYKIPTSYFSTAAAITKNPKQNTYGWIQSTIEKNDLRD